MVELSREIDWLSRVTSRVTRAVIENHLTSYRIKWRGDLNKHRFHLSYRVKQNGDLVDSRVIASNQVVT